MHVYIIYLCMDLQLIGSYLFIIMFTYIYIDVISLLGVLQVIALNSTSVTESVDRVCMTACSYL